MTASSHECLRETSCPKREKQVKVMTTQQDEWKTKSCQCTWSPMSLSTKMISRSSRRRQQYQNVLIFLYLFLVIELTCVMISQTAAAENINLNNRFNNKRTDNISHLTSGNDGRNNFGGHHLRPSSSLPSSLHSSSSLSPPSRGVHRVHHSSTNRNPSWMRDPSDVGHHSSSRGRNNMDMGPLSSFMDHHRNRQPGNSRFPSDQEDFRSRNSRIEGSGSSSIEDDTEDDEDDEEEDDDYIEGSGHGLSDNNKNYTSLPIPSVPKVDDSHHHPHFPEISTTTQSSRVVTPGGNLDPTNHGHHHNGNHHAPGHELPTLEEDEEDEDYDDEEDDDDEDIDNLPIPSIDSTDEHVSSSISPLTPASDVVSTTSTTTPSTTTTSTTTSTTTTEKPKLTTSATTTTSTTTPVPSSTRGSRRHSTTTTIKTTTTTTTTTTTEAPPRRRPPPLIEGSGNGKGSLSPDETDDEDYDSEDDEDDDDEYIDPDTGSGDHDPTNHFPPNNVHHSSTTSTTTASTMSSTRRREPDYATSSTTTSKPSILIDSVDTSDPFDELFKPSTPSTSTTTTKTPAIISTTNNNAKHDFSYYFSVPLFPAVFAGAIVGLLSAILLLMFLVYRMRKKDEGSYVLGANGGGDNDPMSLNGLVSGSNIAMGHRGHGLGSAIYGHHGHSRNSVTPSAPSVNKNRLSSANYSRTSTNGINGAAGGGGYLPSYLS